MTRIAVISDIHGNSFALDAVLSAISAIEPKVVVNLGDSLSGAVDPAATAHTLRAYSEFVTVRGNHDRQLLTSNPDRLVGVDQMTHTVLTEDDRRWLGSAQAVHLLVPDVIAFHGSPTDDLCYLLETVEDGLFREATDDEVVMRLGGAYGRYELYLCGHTHLQRSRTLPDGGLVVNPGSVGWPAFADDSPHPHVVEARTPDARFTVVDRADGRWTAQEYAVAYDHEAAAARAERHGRRDIAHALRTGTADSA